MRKNKKLGAFASGVVAVLAVFALLPTQASAQFGMRTSCDNRDLQGLMGSKICSCSKDSQGNGWQYRYGNRDNDRTCGAVSKCENHGGSLRCDKESQWRHRYGDQTCDNEYTGDRNCTVAGHRWRHGERGQNGCDRDCNQTACEIPDYDLSTTGIVLGNVYEDSNSNGERDADEKGVAGIAVTIEDAENNTFVVRTDENGLYIQPGVAEGEAIVTVDVLTLPSGAKLSAGENPSTVTVVPALQCDGNVTDANCSVAHHCGMSGYHNGYGHRYRNGNCTMTDPADQNATACGGCMDGKGYRYGYRNDNNSHCATIDHSDRNCTGSNQYGYGHRYGNGNCTMTDPADQNATACSGHRYRYGHHLGNACHTYPANGCESTSCTIVYSNAGDDGYTFEADTDQNLTGTVEGLVFIDTNKNKTFDSDEDTPLSDITILILDSNNEVISEVVTDEDGKYLATNIPVGIVAVDIDESSLPDYVDTNISVGTDPTNVEVLPGKTVWEEDNGYNAVLWTP